MSTQNLKSIATGKSPETSQPKDLAHLLMSPKVSAQIKAALPKHMTPDRMARIALTEMRKVPKLQQCEPMSFLGAVIQCAQLGLEPGSGLGHAYILPFEKRAKKGNQWVTVGVEAQLIIGYRGMLDLARRSGQIVSLNATAVYRGDDFHATFGLDPNIHHVPNFDTEDRENADHMLFVYAVAKLKDGGTQFSIMSRREVDRIRERSKSATNGPWVTDYVPMALKTVIRRMFKYLPVSVELQRASMLDERAEADLSQGNEHVLDPNFDPMTVPADDDEIVLTYAELADQMGKATDREQGEMVLGNGADLPTVQLVELQKLFDAKFSTTKE